MAAFVAGRQTASGEQGVVLGVRVAPGHATNGTYGTHETYGLPEFIVLVLIIILVLVLEKLVTAQKVFLREVRSGVILRRRART
jgi:hypothetical protein